MKIKLLSLIGLFAFFAVCSSAQITFQKSYGGVGSSSGAVTQQTTDDGYITVGTTNFSSGTDDIYLIKTDMNGDTLWTRTYGGAGVEYGSSVAQTVDGGYIVVGTTKSFGAGHEDVYLIKTDASGNVMWSKTFGGPGTDDGASVQQTTDKGYIIGGTTDIGAGVYDMLLIKTDSNGQALWTRTYGGTLEDDGNFVRQTKDGGYIIAGTSKSFGGGDNNILVVKTATNGDTLWTKLYGSTGEDYVFSVQQNSDSGYIFTGAESSFAAGSYDCYLMRTNKKGEILWTKAYGGTDWDAGDVAQQTSDGGFIVLGQSFSFGTASDVYLIKTNSTGDTVWTRTFGGSGYDFGQYVQQTKDGGYIISAGEESFGANRDVYFIKTDVNGNNGCHQAGTRTVVTTASMSATIVHPIIGTGGTENTPVTKVGSGATVTTFCTTAAATIDIDGLQPALTAFPNPFTDEITVTGIKQKGEIIIFDVTGKEMMHVAAVEATNIKTDQLLPGFYLLHYIQKDKTSKTVKLIKI